jgi:hypothetical protein
MEELGLYALGRLSRLRFLARPGATLHSEEARSREQRNYAKESGMLRDHRRRFKCMA